MNTTPENALEEAGKHVFVAGVGDTAEKLSALNMKYGLAKIHHYQKARGFSPDAVFIGSPDTTVTRNINRWTQGMGYGGILQWSGDFSILDIKPNGCGMLMGLLPQRVSREVVENRWKNLQGKKISLQSRDLQWDIETGNHFLSLCVPMVEQEKYHWRLPWDGDVFILHSSGKEFRGETNIGPGLYWDRSEKLRRTMQKHSTPWGDLYVLEDKHAEEYHDHCMEVHSFQMKRRELLAKKLLGDFEILFNGTHQGIHSPGTAVLGCYKFDTSIKQRAHMICGPQNPDYPMACPLTLRPDLPIPLLGPLDNFSAEAINELGWTDRLTEITKGERIKKANILPHGGGTAYPYLECPWTCEEKKERLFGAAVSFNGDGKDFSLRRRNSLLEKLGQAPAIELDEAGKRVSFGNPRELPFTYRGEEVLHRTLSYKMGRELGRLQPLWSIGGET